MDKRKVQKLLHYIQGLDIRIGNLDEVLVKIYEFYCNEFIEKISDVEKISREFCQVLDENINDFPCQRYDKIVMQSRIRDFRKFLDDTLSPDRQRIQKEFVNASEIFMPGKQSKVLEVASGGVPYASMLLADRIPNMSSMDLFTMTEKKLKKDFNVDAHNTFLDEGSSLEDYDFVIGNTPCDGTSIMIERCARYDKPYFIRLCPCGLPQDRMLRRPISEWKSYLKGLDSRIKIYKRFAYVLDGPDEKIQKVIDDEFTNPDFFM